MVDMSFPTESHIAGSCIRERRESEKERRREEKERERKGYLENRGLLWESLEGKLAAHRSRQRRMHQITYFKIVKSN
jgi:hypothetical protein